MNKFKYNVVFMFFAMLFWTFSLGTFAQDSIDTSKEKNLIISDGSQFKPKNYYPRFSWNVTPVYCMFGDTKRLLKTEEVKCIAEKTDFICIEKSHGLRVLGASELGAKHEAAAFKKIKPEIKVLFYFNSAYAWPFTTYNKNFTAKRIEKHPELKKFLIIDPQTGKLANRRHVFFFDVLNPEFRKWWVETVLKGVKETGCDGAFIDQMHGFSWLRKDNILEVRKAMGEMMASLKNKLGPNKILLGNNAAQENAKYVFPSVDAIMFEHYNSKTFSKENLLKDWNNMLRIAKSGKISVFRIGVEAEDTLNYSKSDRSERLEKLSKERLEYFLACYLIGAQPYSYFQYGWGWGLSTGPLVNYPELLKPLGSPMGSYVRKSPDKWVFTREFEHASVWLDTEKGEAKISWR